MKGCIPVVVTESGALCGDHMQSSLSVAARMQYLGPPPPPDIPATKRRRACLVWCNALAVSYCLLHDSASVTAPIEERTLSNKYACQWLHHMQSKSKYIYIIFNDPVFICTTIILLIIIIISYYYYYYYYFTVGLSNI